MKKILCLLLSVVLVLGMAACGKSDEPKMPDFSEEALTEAQEYVKAAMADYEIPDREEDFKKAYVMLTDDLAKDMAGKVNIEKWDLSEIDAVVIAFLGDKEPEETDTKDSKKKKTSASSDTVASDATGIDGADTSEELSPVVFLIGGEGKEVAYVKSLKGSTAVADSAMAGVEEVEVDGDAVASAKKALAQAQLDTENYVAKNAEKLGDYPTLLAEKIAQNPDYMYSMEFFSDGLMGTENAMEKGFYAGHLRNEYRAEYVLAQLTAENPKDEDLIDEDYLWFDELFSLLGSLYEVNRTMAQIDGVEVPSEALTNYKAALETAKENENYLFDETYTRAALADETCNTYDNSLRQQLVYQTSIDTIKQIMASSDEDEREYLAERAEIVDANLADYSNMYKTYVQCLVNLDNFVAANADAMAAYEAEVEACKESAGDGYKDSVEYMKIELKYQDMLTSHEGFKNAIPLAKADLDAMKAEQDEKLAELDAEEQERLDEIVIQEEQAAFYEYMKTVTAEVSEYEAAKGQFGFVHPDYAAYQNQHLTYYTSKSSGSSSGSSYKGSYSSGSSSNKGAGGYDMPNEGESFSDYVQRVDPDLYDAMTDIYNDAVYGY